MSELAFGEPDLVTVSALPIVECQAAIDIRLTHGGVAAVSELDAGERPPATVSALPVIECQPVVDTESPKPKGLIRQCSCPGCPARARKKRKKRKMETAEYAGMLRRTIQGYGLRIGEGDPEDLATAVQLAADLDQVIDDAARAMRASTGYSWAELGRALGTTRQAAQQRYGGGG